LQAKPPWYGPHDDLMDTTSFPDITQNKHHEEWTVNTKKNDQKHIIGDSTPHEKQKQAV